MCINTTSVDLHYVVPAAARYLATAVAVASALCSLAIVVAHIVLRCWRRRRRLDGGKGGGGGGGGMEAHSRMFIVYLSACDVLACSANATGALAVYGSAESAGALRLCQGQSLVGIVSSLAFVLWVLSFVVFLYVMIPLDGIKSAIRYRAAFHLVSWGIPVLVAVLAYTLGALPTASGGAEVATQGGSGGAVATNLVNRYSRATVGWCWIGERPAHPSALRCEDARLLWMLLTGRGWELLAYAVMAVLVAMMRRYVNQLCSPLSRQYSHPNFSNIKRNMRSISNKAYALVMSFILLRIWGTVRVFFDYGTFYNQHQTVNDVFTYLQAVGDNAQGIVNFVLFVAMAPKIRSDLAQALGVRLTCAQLCCCCCRRYDDWQRGRVERRAMEERARDVSSDYCGLAHAYMETDEDGQSTQDSLTISVAVSASTTAAVGLLPGKLLGRPRRKSNASATTSEHRSSAADLEMTVSYSPRPMSLNASGQFSMNSSGHSLQLPIPELSEAPSSLDTAPPVATTMTSTTMSSSLPPPTTSSPQPMSYTSRAPSAAGYYTDVSGEHGGGAPHRSAAVPARPRLVSSPLLKERAQRRTQAEVPLLSDMDNMDVDDA